MSHVETTVAQIRRAACAEDLFGADPAGVNDAFRALAKVVHPDHHAAHPLVVALATAGFALLNERKREADQKIAEGTYGDRKPPKPKTKTVIKVAGDQLELGALIRTGDIADVYAGRLRKRAFPVVVKIARSPKDNDLMRAEREVLGKLDAIEDKGRRYFAEATKATLDVGGRVGNVLVRYPNHVPLDVIRTRASTLDFRDMAWMLRRMLEGLGHLHRAGYVHGNLIPPNLLFHPTDHGLRIVDWCYAVPVGKPAKAKSTAWASAPEVGKRPLTPATDIYMAAWSARWMLGEDGQRYAPRPVWRFLEGCLIENPTHRPADAWQLHEELGELLRRLVGAPKYHLLAIADGESFT